jgi:hypothetical protein
MSALRATSRTLGACGYNLLLAYALLFVARLIFYVVNIAYFDTLTADELWTAFVGSLKFDASALAYLNSLYVLLMLLPLHYKECDGYRRAAKIVFVVCNGLGLLMNLADTVYFRYTDRRTTATIFSEFQHESNLTNIVGIELLRHWYLTLAAVALIVGLWKAYRTPRVEHPPRLLPYYAMQFLCLAGVGFLCVTAMRGGIGRAVRPITISNAAAYVNRPIDTALVLNTPFSFIRTIGKKPFKVVRYYPDEASLAEVFTPVHQPPDTATFRPMNVVVFILESFTQEYIDEGYAPFLDSLMARGLTYEYSFAGGRKSIDAMPSVLSSIP